MVKIQTDFAILVTCLLNLALQIHNPFQRSVSSCVCDGQQEVGASARQVPDSTGAADRRRAEVQRRPKEVAPQSGGRSTESLLRELDAIQAKAKEQQDVLAENGRMPPPSAILQQLKESEAGYVSQAAPLQQTAAQVPRTVAPPVIPQASAPAAMAGQVTLVARRDDLGRFLQANQPRGLGIILGVGRGDFALRLLSEWSSAVGLYLVDPYIQIWKGYDDPANVADREHQLIFEDLRHRLAPFDGRYVLVRDFSYSFAETYSKGNVATGAPTFVYVDANHGEEAVTRDLESWWPLLVRGGLLGGSSYLDDPSGVRVRAAVDRFAARHQASVILTTSDPIPSWFIVKA